MVGWGGGLGGCEMGVGVGSHGGHMFAAVNGNTVNIFATYTCENLGNLRGHNGKVLARQSSLSHTHM